MQGLTHGRPAAAGQGRAAAGRQAGARTHLIEPAARGAMPAEPAQPPGQAAPLGLAQRALGNRAVQRALAVGAPDDDYEREADRVADQVMRRATDTAVRRAAVPRAGPAPGLPLGALQRAVGNRVVSRLCAGALQRRCACGGDSGASASAAVGEREDHRAAPAASAATLQRRPAEDRAQDGFGAAPVGDEPAGGASMTAPPIVQQVLSTPGQPLAESARRVLEPGFGHDFGRVRVHDDAQAARSAQAVQARAYAVGEHIVFDAGQYRPDSADGQRLLAHELTHTIQQTGGAPLGVQRYSWDEFVDDAGAVADSAADSVGQAADAAVSGAQAVGEAAVSGAQAVGEAAVSGAQAVGDAAVAGAQAVGQGAAAIVDTASDAVDWALTQAGQVALAEANALAGLAGGSVKIGPDGLVIDLPEIDLFDSFTVPIVPPLPRDYVPLIGAGAAIGPVVLIGTLGISLGAPVVNAFVGPGRLRAIRIRIDPVSGVYSASGQLYMGAALNAYLQTGAALRVDALTAIPTDPPIPVDVALEGGLLLTEQGSVPGSIAQTVTLSYSGGAIGLDLDTTVQLGAILEADLSAYLNAQLYGVELCEFIWPLRHWQDSVAGQLNLPVSLRYGGGGPPVSVGPVTTAPIAVDAIETGLQRFVPQTRCKSIEEIIDELCEQKKLPPELCDLFEGDPGEAASGLAGSCVANDNLGEVADGFISRCRKASIRSEFPGELLTATLGTIKKGKSAAHRKAWKLLNDNRFKKPGASGAGLLPDDGASAAQAARSNRIRVQLQHKSDDVVPAETREADGRSVTVAEGHDAVDKLMDKTSKSVGRACAGAQRGMKNKISKYPPQGVSAAGNVARNWCNDHPDFERGIRLDLENLAGTNFTS